MKKLSVIELSEHTGLTRSQIYHLIKKGKLIILNGKINYTDAMQVITTLPLKKTQMNNEENFKHASHGKYHSKRATKFSS